MLIIDEQCLCHHDNARGAVTALESILIDKGLLNGIKAFDRIFKTLDSQNLSAIKINGERAYKLARAGKDVEIPSRTVTIYELEILDYDAPLLKIRTHVSSGTYIRTLAEDLGKALGCGAYCTELRRTKIADYDIAELPLFELPA